MADHQARGGAVPDPPWRLIGECMLGWVRPDRSLRSLLPEGLKPLVGPAALVAVSYAGSPVGPYLELSLALPARIGLRPGLCVIFQVVSEPDARRAYRTQWGLPASIGPLSWHEDGAERILRFAELGLEVRGHPVGPSFPAVVPVRSLQRRSDGPVVLPRRFAGLVRLARTTVTVEPDGGGPEADVFRRLGGTHPGALMHVIRIVARPARQPAGLWSSLRAPLPGVEPAFARVTPRTGA